MAVHEFTAQQSRYAGARKEDSMKRLMTANIVAGLVMALAPLAQGQFGPENRYGPSEVSALIDRVHVDLDHAYGVWHFSDSDRDRLNNAEKQLREFAGKWSKAKFDRGELNSAIDAIQHVLDNNRLPQEQRDALSDDETQLRRMRDAYDHHEIG
jgi:hypothetical protein